MSGSVTRRIVSKTETAPPGGPYSLAVIVGDTLHFSGQIGRDKNGIQPEGIEAQTHQCLQNVSKVLEASGDGISLKNVVKLTIFLANIDDWGKVNEIYKQYFQPPYPARSAIAVKDLPMRALIEIEGMAIVADIIDQ